MRNLSGSLIDPPELTDVEVKQLLDVFLATKTRKLKDHNEILVEAIRVALAQLKGVTTREPIFLDLYKALGAVGKSYYSEEEYEIK